MTAQVTRPDLAGDTGWVKCRRCLSLTYGKRFARTLNVCPDCGWHAPMTAAQRIDHLLDAGGRVSVEAPPSPTDPLDFVDTVPYRQRLEDARARTGADEAVLCAQGTLDGRPAVVVAMDFRFLGGSLGGAVGERITRAAERALEERIPLIIVTASGGARMQEGAISLMQMAKTSQALAQLDEAGVLTVAVVADPTYGGVAASFASLTDVVIAEPGARLGFAGPRVIKQTIRRELPEGFQSAEFLLDHGLVDDVVPRERLRTVLARLLDCARPGRPFEAPADIPAPRPAVKTQEPWDVVKLARHIDRPTTQEYVGHLLEGFHELHGDRASADCAAIVGGLGLFDGSPVVLIGHQKGHTTGDLIKRNFGMPSPAGYRKTARLMRLAAKLSAPVVTLIDTPGAYPGPEAEEQGQSIAIAENLRLMSRLPVPVVAVVTGEGGSGGALALGVANRVLIQENAIYSVISPEGCAAILWQSATAAPVAAAALRLTAPDLLRQGVVDEIVPEPRGGAHTDHLATADALRRAIRTALAELAPLTPDELVEQRWARFRRFGA